ncbi:MAG: glycoside hydrolase family 2 TIM barrel-domain containing protein [Planctomycetota bacterium]
MRLITLIGAVTAAALGHTDLDTTIATGLRDTRALDGDWSYIIDPYDHGRIDYRSRVRTDGFWMDATPSSPADRVEYAFDDKHTLRVPGDWNTQQLELLHYEGVVWYRTQFDAIVRDHERTFIRFGAANKRADAWLNGAPIGSNSVGFTPFAFEVTDTLRAGANSLVVRVDNTRRPEGVPAMQTDWFNYGGLTRSVELLAVPETFIADAHVGLREGGRVADGWVRLDGPDAANALFDVTFAGVSITTNTDEHGVGRFALNADTFARWSPQSPKLHDFEVRYGNDTLRERVGLRTVATSGDQILLNDEPVFLRGICLHEEPIAPRGGRSSGLADARELLTLAKELGCNYVRLAHYTHDEATLRLADELGLMVWAEIPVYWMLDYDNPETLAEAETHLRGMIARDHNRASVIIWSIGNEMGDDVSAQRFRLKLGALAKRLDPSRLLSAALFARQERDAGRLVRMVIEDPFGEVADVLAINQYVGWYHDQPESLRGVAIERRWNKPFVFSEFGAGVKHGLRGEPEAVWTEDFGVRYYNENLDWIESLDSIAGLSPWILKDFRSPRRPLYGIQDGFNRKGLVSETGERKLVFDVLRERYERWAMSPPGRRLDRGR